MPRTPQPVLSPALASLMGRSKSLGINPAALALLAALAEGPASQTELEAKTGVRRATLSDHLRALEADGFVHASVAPEERRGGRRGCDWTLDREAVEAWLSDFRTQVAGNA